MIINSRFTKLKLRQVPSIAKNVLYLLAAILTSTIATQVHASETKHLGLRSGAFFSFQTGFFLIVGIIISAIYLQKMLSILKNSAATYDLDQQDESKDTFHYSFLGTIISVTFSALVIWAYGLRAFFLYLGPVLCLLSPLVLIYCMSVELSRFREIMQANKRLR